MKYIRDIFTTLIDVKWRWSLLIFAVGFFFSWLIFSIIYFLIMLARGDFDIDPTDPNRGKPCIMNLVPHSFTSVFLFSLESQHTIGYGHRYITESCPSAIIVLCLQSIAGVIIQSFFAGVVFAKLARPKKRAETLIFSKNAVIYMRDGKMCLLFRVGDMRRSHLVEAHVRLQMIKKKVTTEGEMLAFHQFDMDVGYDEGLDRIFLVWPLTICHVIDEDSPLYEYSAEDLLSARFEIVAILEGIVESTGMTTQARTSWLPSEILWGHRFEKLVTYQRENGDYKIDYARFHNSYPVDTPRCSAMQLDEMKEHGLMMPAVTVDAEAEDSQSGVTECLGNSSGAGSPVDGPEGAEDETPTTPGDATGTGTREGLHMSLRKRFSTPSTNGAPKKLSCRNEVTPRDSPGRIEENWISQAKNPPDNPLVPRGPCFASIDGNDTEPETETFVMSETSQCFPNNTNNSNNNNNNLTNDNNHNNIENNKDDDDDNTDNNKPKTSTLSSGNISVKYVSNNAHDHPYRAEGGNQVGVQKKDSGQVNAGAHFSGEPSLILDTTTGGSRRSPVGPYAGSGGAEAESKSSNHVLPPGPAQHSSPVILNICDE